MLIPIRCLTCGSVLADKYDYYLAEVQKQQKQQKETQTAPPVAEMRHFEPLRTGPILDKLNLKRMCCRRMMLGTEDMMETI